jgi:hypothetical protein
MKAEHRKELQTNTLAASMGRLVQQIKKKPQRRTVLWITLAAVVLVVIVGYFFIRSNQKKRDSELWTYLEVSSPEAARVLATEWRDSNPGVAARFQQGYLYLWEFGIKRLPQRQLQAEGASPGDFIRAAKRVFEELAEETKDDSILASEALYSVAVAQEALAVRELKDLKAEGEMARDLSNALDEAARLYKKVEDRYPETARAKEAAKRRKQLDGKDTRPEIMDFYTHLTFATRMARPLFPPDHPPIPVGPGKAKAEKKL